jgi:copper homeostasis protein
MFPGIDMKNFLFELCGESLESARRAESGGAQRIELCAQLRIGGVTPDFGLVEAAVRALSIPVHVLIRPRPGDFVLGPGEFVRMQMQIEQAKQAGARGVVLGILLSDGRVDVDHARALVELARPMTVTFHRAFDKAANLNEALEAVIQTGADCLLTSGGAADVRAGAETIAQIAQQAAGRIEIMAGGGLRLTDIAELVRRTGVSFLHGSLIRKVPGQPNPEVQEADIREAIRMLQSVSTENELVARADKS